MRACHEYTVLRRAGCSVRVEKDFQSSTPACIFRSLVLHYQVLSRTSTMDNSTTFAGSGYSLERGLSFTQRIAVYLGLWLLAVIAFEIWLTPEGMTETHLTEAQQRIQWPLYTPLMVVVGIVEPFSPSGDLTSNGGWIAVVFLVHAVVMLTSKRLPVFAGLACVQLALLAIGVVNFIRLSQLPSGG